MFLTMSKATALSVLFMLLPFVGLTQKPDPYYDIRIGDARIDAQIFESEFVGQNTLRMTNRRNKDLNGYEFIGGTLRVKNTDEVGTINGNELSQDAIDLLEDSGGKLIEFTVKFKDTMGKVKQSKSIFAVINDSGPAPEE